jgi:uncharacterized protein (DUF58 family)
MELKPIMPEKLFDDEFVSTLEYLAVLAKRVFAKQRQLRERMRKLGSGQEFADHRAYSPGDDFRYLDWNLYGRLGKLLLRVFEEEEDLRVTFLLDSSASMKIETKFDAARRLVAALAYVALSRFDEVAIAPFAERRPQAARPIHLPRRENSHCPGGGEGLQCLPPTFANRTRRWIL